MGVARQRAIKVGLEKTYGTNSSVLNALAGHLDERWDEFELSEDRDELFLCIWNWLAGGSTAEIAADRVRQSVARIDG